MQGSSRSAQQRRPDKQASSCTECRRRKQKCSQGQPCTNCARRFPQPICDYGVQVRRTTGSRVADRQAAKVVAKEGPYPHLNLAGIQDAILQIEVASTSKDKAAQKGEHEFEPIDYGTEGIIPLSAGPQAEEQRLRGHLRNWLPFRLMINTRVGEVDDAAIIGTLKSVLEHQKGDGTELNDEEDWMVDAARLIWSAQRGSQPTSSLQKLDQEMRHLPMSPTKLNKELVRTHLRLLSRFKASVSGIPNPENPFMKHWVPFIIQDPLLINTVLFTSACFLNETGHLPKSIVVAIRGVFYGALNEKLRSPDTQLSDAAILAVAEMLLHEWYWGATKELHAHLKGLKTMIRLRGGLQDLGMHGFISKMILIHDISMSLSHETTPEMYGLPGFEFNDPVMVPFQMPLNSPLTLGWPSFASSASSLRLHPCTAKILDDSRAVIEAALALPEDATVEQMELVAATAAWAINEINELPDNVPLYRSQQQNKPHPTEVSSDTSSPPNTDEGSVKTSKSNRTGTSPQSAGSTPNERKGKNPTGSSPQTEDVERSVEPPSNPDPVYRMVRLTATVYCRAILARRPTSHVLSDKEFYEIWSASWRCPMITRSSLLGIFLWVMLLLAPNCHDKAPSRFIKSLVVGGFLTGAVDNWHVTIGAGEAALRLQRWLKGSSTMKGIIIGGEKAIEKHGFAVKDVLKNIETIHKSIDDDEDEEQDHNMGR